MTQAQPIGPEARDLLEDIHARFNATGEWPRYRDLELDGAEADPPFHELVRILENHAHVLVDRPVRDESRCTLTMDAFRLLDGGGRDLSQVARVARYLAGRYLDQRRECRVSGSEIASALKLSSQAAERAYTLIDNTLGHLANIVQREADGAVVFHVRAHAHHFRSVTNAEELLAAEERARAASDADHRLGPRHEATLRLARGVGNVPASPSGGRAGMEHPKVRDACETLLASGHWAHVVLETARVIEAAIKELLPSEDAYGSKLVEVAFGGKKPKVPLSDEATDAVLQQHKAVMHLARGLYALRNSVAHGNASNLTEADARGAMALATMILFRLEHRHSGSGDSHGPLGST